ncbi:MAG: hypothetical protein ACT4OX_04670 [Actinomycetota bacterium]
MNEYRFINPSQPQTLQTGVMLCYFRAVLGLLFGLISTSLLLEFLIIAGLAAGGFGVANEKRWGYALAVSAAGVHVLMYLVIFGFSGILDHMRVLISFVFAVALLMLLLHPMSRDYQRIWFK